VRRAGLVLASLLSMALPVAPGTASENWHAMTLPDGSLDKSKCGACHTEDMSLAATKLETCTACHSETEHSGTLEHLRVDAAKVAEAMKQRPKGSVAMPLADDGKIYCGTCHLFHDPKVRNEAWLVSGWVPPDAGLPGAVRQSVLELWASFAERHDANGPVGEFASHGTRMLRLPVNDGSLCRQCHGALR